MYRFEPKRTYKPKIILGTHNSIVADIFFDPDYADDSAIRVNYHVTTDEGEEFNYSELFFNIADNDRTKAFCDYLADNGIEIQNLSAFRGCHERITIKKRVDYHNTAHPSIIDREFVAHPEADNAVENP